MATPRHHDRQVRVQPHHQREHERRAEHRDDVLRAEARGAPPGEALVRSHDLAGRRGLAVVDDLPAERHGGLLCRRSAVTPRHPGAGWPISASGVGSRAGLFTTALRGPRLSDPTGRPQLSVTRYGRGMASLPVAAPLPARAHLTGPLRPGRVVGVHPSCVYVVSDPDRPDGTGSVVAVETADGVGLPCALRLGRRPGRRPVRRDRGRGPGDGRRGTGRRRRSRGPGRALVVAADRPAVERAGARALARAGRAPSRRTPSGRPGPATAHDLLGRGPGLTPAGDDVLAGWLLAVHHVDDLRAAPAAVLAAAPTATTALSATLLQEAAAGRGVPAAVALADALGGRGDVAPALRPPAASRATRPAPRWRSACCAAPVRRAGSWWAHEHARRGAQGRLLRLGHPDAGQPAGRPTSTAWTRRRWRWAPS